MTSILIHLPENNPHGHTEAQAPSRAIMELKSNSRTRRFRGFRLCPGSEKAKDTLFRIQQQTFEARDRIVGKI